MNGLVTIILSSLIAVAYTADFNSTWVTHLSEKKFEIEGKAPDLDEHYYRANQASLALFYDDAKHYLGSGALVSAFCILTVQSVIEKISHAIEAAQIVFEVDRQRKPYSIKHNVDIQGSRDLILTVLKDKVVENIVGILQTPMVEENLEILEAVRIEYKQMSGSASPRLLQTVCKSGYIHENVMDRQSVARTEKSVNNGTPLFYKRKLIGLAVSRPLKDQLNPQYFRIKFVNVGPWYPQINELIQHEDSQGESRFSIPQGSVRTPRKRRPNPRFNIGP